MPYHGANGSGLDSSVYGVIRRLTKDDDTARQAMEAAQALTPQPREISGPELALQFFSNMAANASQPGATVLSSAASAVKPTADEYIRQVEANRKAQAATGPLAISLAKALKPDKVTAGTPVQVMVDGKPVFMSPEEALGKEAYQKDSKKTFSKPYELLITDVDAYNSVYPKNPLGPDNKVYLTNEQTNKLAIGSFDILSESPLTEAKKYFVPTNQIDAFRIEHPNISISDTGIVLVNAEQFYMGNTQNIVQAVDTATGEKETAISKLFSDLEKAEVGSPRAIAIQAQITAETRKAGFDKDMFEGEIKIQNSWNTARKSLTESEIQYSKMSASFAAKNGPGDLAMIFGFMKMLDPGSVVRESEFSAAQDTAGLYQKLKVQAEKLKKGDLLTEQQRENFLDLGEKYLNAGKMHMAKIRLNKGVHAESFGFSAPNIFGVEIATPKFYLDKEVYFQSEKDGILPDAIWLQMSDAEKARYQ